MLFSSCPRTKLNGNPSISTTARRYEPSRGRFRFVSAIMLRTPKIILATISATSGRKPAEASRRSLTQPSNGPGTEQQVAWVSARLRSKVIDAGVWPDSKRTYVVGALRKSSPPIRRLSAARLRDSPSKWIRRKPSHAGLAYGSFGPSRLGRTNPDDWSIGRRAVESE